MAMSDRVGDAELALRAALAGASVVRAGFGTRLARFDKGDGDYATEADLAAEAAIVGVLRAARPSDAVLGEESGWTGDAGAGRRWLVDPLCGTQNFATGAMTVGVNVALRDGDEVAAAAVADPFAGEVFWTDGATASVRKINAWPADANDTAGANEPAGMNGPIGIGGDRGLRPSAESAIVEVNLDPPASTDGFEEWRLIADGGFRERFQVRVLSTSLPLAWVAAGRRAAYVIGGRSGHRGDVHFAAGIALCRAAGAVVSAIDGGPLGDTTVGLVAAADAATHAALISTITAARPVEMGEAG